MDKVELNGLKRSNKLQLYLKMLEFEIMVNKLYQKYHK